MGVPNAIYHATLELELSEISPLKSKGPLKVGKMFYKHISPLSLNNLHPSSSNRGFMENGQHISHK
jgi:hypothetical protein